VLYELASGQPPHLASDYWSLRSAAIEKDVEALGKRVAALPPDFAAIVDRCLRRDPAERFASGEELVAALSQQQKSAAEPPPPPPRLSPRRRRFLVLGLGSTVVAAGFLLWRLSQPVGGMVDFAAGRFVMGAAPDEILSVQEWCKNLLGSECDEVVQKAFRREQPQRKVELSAFRLDRREVTTQEFADWLNAQPDLQLESARYVKQRGVLLADVYPMYDPFGGFTYDPQQQKYVVPQKYRRRPATQVSWHAADRYCQSQGKRLPTEAEWEFAARGPEGRRFPWGYEEPTCQGTVVSRRTGMLCAAFGTGPGDVASAAQDRTPEGIHDLGGSVAEWVADGFAEQYPSCPEPCRNPLVHPDQVDGQRVVRGSAWEWPTYLARGTTRSRYAANAAPINFGFRCAVSRGRQKP
jgi:formylglycine-generating enzyme required for sulfatase activity